MYRVRFTALWVGIKDIYDCRCVNVMMRAGFLLLRMKIFFALQKNGWNLLQSVIRPKIIQWFSELWEKGQFFEIDRSITNQNLISLMTNFQTRYLVGFLGRLSLSNSVSKIPKSWANAANGTTSCQQTSHRNISFLMVAFNSFFSRELAYFLDFKWWLHSITTIRLRAATY